MMNYEEFKQKVQNEFKNYLGEEYKDAEVFIREVTKVNMQVDQMTLLNLPEMISHHRQYHYRAFMRIMKKQVTLKVLWKH